MILFMIYLILSRRWVPLSTSTACFLIRLSRMVNITTPLTQHGPLVAVLSLLECFSARIALGHQAA